MRPGANWNDALQAGRKLDLRRQSSLPCMSSPPPTSNRARALDEDGRPGISPRAELSQREAHGAGGVGLSLWVALVGRGRGPEVDDLQGVEEASVLAAVRRGVVVACPAGGASPKKLGVRVGQPGMRRVEAGGGKAP